MIIGSPAAVTRSAGFRNSLFVLYFAVWWMIGCMPAVGVLVRCTDGSWMTRPPQRCPRGHRLRPGHTLAMVSALVGS